MAVCPKCGSDKFHYELRSAGSQAKTNYYRTGVKDSWLVPAGRKKRNSDLKQKTVGFCPDCGYMTDKPMPVQQTGTPQPSFKLSPGVKKGLLIWLIASAVFLLLIVLIQAIGGAAALPG